jgi:hypothetical protein
MPREDTRDKRDKVKSGEGSGGRGAKIAIEERRKALETRQPPPIPQGESRSLARETATQLGSQAIATQSDGGASIDWEAVSEISLRPTTPETQHAITKTRMLIQSKLMGLPEGYTPSPGGRRGRMG